MDSLAGVSLINAAGDLILADTLLASTDIVLFYFSAYWCPPCRQFTPVLKEFYTKVAKEGKLEVVFVSSDRSQEDMFSYMKECHGAWVAVQHNSALANDLKQKYGVKSIPNLVVIKKDGKMVTANGREDVTSKSPQDALKDWQK